MAFAPSLSRRIQQELMVGFAAMILAVLGILLFVQEKYIYYLIGFLSFAAIVWCQANTKRWIYLTIITIPISPSFPIWKFKNPVTSELSDFVVMIVLMVFGFNYLMNQSKRKGFDKYITLPLLGYSVMAIISCAAGYYVHYEKILVINAAGHFFKWFSYLFLYIVIFKFFKNDKELKDLLRVTLLSITVGAAVAAASYFHNPVVQGRVHRSSGFMEGENAFAAILVIILLFYFNLVIQKKSRELFPNWIFYPCLMVILLALVTTFSRTGWAALAAGLIIIAFFKGRNYVAALVIVMTIVAFLVLGKPAQQRIERTFEVQPWSHLPIDIGGREGLWLLSISRFKDTGFWGVGYLNFGQTVMGTMPHNLFLALIGESGPLGLFLFLFLYYRLFKSTFFIYRHHPDPFFKNCAFGMTIILFIIFIIEFLGEFLYGAPLIFTLFSLYGVCRISFQNEVDKARETQRLDKPLLRLNYQLNSFK